MFYVMCRVSGGVTGTREALLKANGVVVEFETREAAETKAKHLNREMNHEHSVAFFQYWVIEQ